MPPTPEIRAQTMPNRLDHTAQTDWTNAVCGRLAAAGFVPKPCQTLATKSAERHLRNALITEQDLLSSWHIYRAAFGRQLATTYGGQASTDGQPETSRNEKTRRGGTTAGFVPKPCQTLATKTAERHLRNALNSLLDLLSSWHI